MKTLCILLATLIAYVTSWNSEIPDPSYLTCINYAFGHVNETFDGVRIDNPEKLQAIVALKEQNPELKVVLSIGGWGSGRFSEMVTDPHLRRCFAKDCRRVVDEFDLDGIDIDWEYPGSSVAGISSAPTDRRNYTRLMRDIRKAIGRDRILSHATEASCKFIDYKAVNRYVDYTNVMTYDMGDEHTHNSPLFKSALVHDYSADECMQMYVRAGVPRNKLVMGLAFYGRGRKDFRKLWDKETLTAPEGYSSQWDAEAGVPYITDDRGEFVFGYENTTSLRLKAYYIRQQGFLGAMYWSYESDNSKGDFRRTVREELERTEEPVF